MSQIEKIPKAKISQKVMVDLMLSELPVRNTLFTVRGLVSIFDCCSEYMIQNIISAGIYTLKRRQTEGEKNDERQK